MTNVDLYTLIRRNLFNLGVENLARSIVHFFEDIFDGNILLRNKPLENMHEGKRCFIFGTGLSVNDIELSKLAGEYTFGGNFINYHPDFHKLNLKFYVSLSSPLTLKYVHSKEILVDSNIFSEEDMKVWLDNESTLLTYSIEPYKYFSQIDTDLDNNTLLFLGAGSKKFIEKNNIFKDKDIFYLKPYKPLLSAKDQIIDLSKRITFYENVVLTMLAIAMYMGFEEIFIVGNDYTFEPAREFHFYDELHISKTIGCKRATEWIEKIANARNIEVYKIMEDKDYYKPIFVKYNKKRDAHIVVKNFVESMGVRIFNITPEDFESPVYRGVSWQYVVENVLAVKQVK
jgi:hypothetical protein